MNRYVPNSNALVCAHDYFDFDDPTACAFLLAHFDIKIERTEALKQIDTLRRVSKQVNGSVQLLQNSTVFTQSVIKQFLAQNDLNITAKSLEPPNRQLDAKDIAESAYAHLNLWLWFQHAYRDMGSNQVAIEYYVIAPHIRDRFCWFDFSFGLVSIFKRTEAVRVRNTRDYFIESCAPKDCEFIISCIRENFELLPTVALTVANALVDNGAVNNEKPCLFIISAENQAILFGRGKKIRTGLVRVDTTLLETVWDFGDAVKKAARLDYTSFTSLFKKWPQNV